MGRPKVSEQEAAGWFVLDTLKRVHANWRGTVESLREIPTVPELPFDDRNIECEFVLAAVVAEAQTVPNLLPRPQAMRIRSHVIACLSAPELGTYPAQAYGEYEATWNNSLHAGELPLHGVAVALLRKLGGGSPTQFLSSIAVMAIGTAILPVGWWKKFLSAHELAR